MTRNISHNKAHIKVLETLDLKSTDSKWYFAVQVVGIPQHENRHTQCARVHINRCENNTRPSFASCFETWRAAIQRKILSLREIVARVKKKQKTNSFP